MDNGYWTKFEVVTVEKTPERPYGIKYSLTLHDRANARILGFDNAHAWRPKKKRYVARKITWDHIHEREKTSKYEYESASQLLIDFWAVVDEILEQG